MKLFVRFFLLLSFLLLRGTGYPNAHTHQENSSFAVSKNTERPLYISLCAVHPDRITIVKPINSRTRKLKHITEVAAYEDEDEETASFRKFVIITNFFIALLPDDTRNCAITTTRKNLACQTHFSLSPAYNYIMLRVIRI